MIKFLKYEFYNKLFDGYKYNLNPISSSLSLSLSLSLSIYIYILLLLLLSLLLSSILAKSSFPVLSTEIYKYPILQKKEQKRKIEL